MRAIDIHMHVPDPPLPDGRRRPQAMAEYFGAGPRQ